MNPSWHIRTGRLHLSPVGWADLPDLQRLKGDPATHAQMLGGIRSPGQVADDLAADASYWAARGVGMWIARPIAGGPALGLTGIHDRPDGRSPALRFAFTPACRGHGYAREAAGAALRFAHGTGLPQVFAVAKDSNIASRTVLGAIGMKTCDAFLRGDEPVTVYESVVRPAPDWPGRRQAPSVLPPWSERWNWGSGR